MAAGVLIGPTPLITPQNLARQPERAKGQLLSSARTGET